VQEGAAQVEVRPSPPQDQGHAAVDQEPQSRHENDQASPYFHRLDEPEYGAVEEEKADERDDEGVDKGHHDAHAVIAEGLFLRRRPGHHAHGDEGEDQGEGVREIMARVTQQRQAARDDPEDDLENEKRRVGRDGCDQTFRGLEVLGVILRQYPFLPGTLSPSCPHVDTMQYYSLYPPSLCDVPGRFPLPARHSLPFIRYEPARENKGFWRDIPVRGRAVSRQATWGKCLRCDGALFSPGI